MNGLGSHNVSPGLGNPYFDDEVYLSEEDFLSDSEAEDNEDVGNGLVVKTQPNSANLIAQAGNILVKKNVSNDDKIDAIVSVLHVIGQKFQQDDQDKAKLDKKFVKLQSDFNW